MHCATKHQNPNLRAVSPVSQNLYVEYQIFLSRKYASFGNSAYCLNHFGRFSYSRAKYGKFPQKFFVDFHFAATYILTECFKLIWSIYLSIMEATFVMIWTLYGYIVLFLQTKLLTNTCVYIFLLEVLRQHLDRETWTQPASWYPTYNLTDFLHQKCWTTTNLFSLWNYRSKWRRIRFAIYLLDSKDAQNPYKHRIIAGSAKCSTKPLSILLTKLITHIKQGFEKYCETAYSRSGVNQM